ncbi:MAG: hypothetical protein ACP5HQ_04175 [Thermoprotei archaeon]
MDLDEVFIRLIEDRPRPRGSKTTEADLKRLAELARDDLELMQELGCWRREGGCDILQDWLLGKLRKRLSELVGSETDRFLKFLAIINTLLEEKGLGRIIIVGGFAAELYSARAVRTGDVDVVVEGEKALEAFRELLREISVKGSRVYLPKVREISEKAIDIVGTVYDRRKPPVKFSVNGYRVYVLPPEEVVLTYLDFWKSWNSLEDRNKAVVA